MWKTYSAKTLYRTEVSGEPFATDEDYTDSVDLVEERVVTVKARSFDEAIKRGELEAVEYTKGMDHINPYGQEVTTRYVGNICVFEPYDNVPANIEVYSSTFLIKRTVSDKKLADGLFGIQKLERKYARKVFLNVEFNGYVIS